MSLDLEITNAWEHANNACGALAEAIHATGNDNSNKARGNALLLLQESRVALNTAVAMVEAQISTVAKGLRTNA